jgi:phosphoribosylformylglycinamidine cyclo-ligase
LPKLPEPPPIFRLIQALGHITMAEMYRTFNMGVGMVIVCSLSDAESIKTHFSKRGDDCFQIGEVIAGDREVLF